MGGTFDAAVRGFALADTRKQRDILHRVGLDTECADKLLGHLRGMYPDRADALLSMLDAEDKYGRVA